METIVSTIGLMFHLQDFADQLLDRCLLYFFSFYSRPTRLYSVSSALASFFCGHAGRSRWPAFKPPLRPNATAAGFLNGIGFGCVGLVFVHAKASPRRW